MNVACLCIDFDLSFTQKERDVFLNLIPPLLKQSNLKTCKHYVNHLKQLMFIEHNLFKLTIALLKRDFGIVRHTRKISLIF